jgi:hypothetical protein
MRNPAGYSCPYNEPDACLRLFQGGASVSLCQVRAAQVRSELKTRNRMIYFGFLAVLMLSEMLTSNIYSLLGPLEATAKMMGVSVAEERNRLIVLIFLDAVPGIGALLVIRAYRRGVATSAGRMAVMATTVGMIVYGVYQFWSATFQLGNMQHFVQWVGVVYSLLGAGAWFIGGDLRKGPASAGPAG